jgi:hypothetical protein
MQIARAAFVSLTLLLGCNAGSSDSSSSDAAPSTSTSTSTNAAGGFDVAKLERESAAAMTQAMALPGRSAGRERRRGADVRRR